MNQHDPPSDREVKIVYSATITKLRQDIIELEDQLANAVGLTSKANAKSVRHEATIRDLKTQRADLLEAIRELVFYAYREGPVRESAINQGKRLYQIIREEMETE